MRNLTRLPFILLCWLAAALPAMAQERLTLAQAVRRAIESHPSAKAAASAELEAQQRVTQAQAGFFPRLDVAESWQRGNQPVFVFGSLLSQRRFTEANFAIDALNHPDPLSNFRLSMGVQQVIFDGLATVAAVKAARTGVAAAGEQRAMTRQHLAVDVTQAYGDLAAAEANLLAARSAVEAASEDLERVQARQETGLATLADTLAVQVHVADMRATEVAAQGQVEVARARLNELVGAPLDAVWALTLEPGPVVDTADLAALEREALTARPEVKLAALQVTGALAGYEMARAAWMPQVAFQTGWEWNGGSFDDRASSWVLGTEVRFNVFRGGADRARLAESRLAIERQARERELAEQRVRLDTRMAQARLRASLARADVGRDAVARAKESQRIVRDRYEAGLEDVTSLLRAAQALRQAEALEIAGKVGVLVDTAGLERALGRLPQ
jgi:outer membrane protein TolC